MSSKQGVEWVLKEHSALHTPSVMSVNRCTRAVLATLARLMVVTNCICSNVICAIKQTNYKHIHNIVNVTCCPVARQAEPFCIEKNQAMLT